MPAKPAKMCETIALADSALSEAFLQMNYRLGTNESVIDHTEVRDQQGRYLFAWHRQENHLLFYIREEALKIRSTLHQSAMAKHGDCVRRNKGGETLITLRSDRDAATLVEWLFPKLQRF